MSLTLTPPVSLRVEGASAPSPLYSCGRCPSGLHTADMSRAEAIKHAALVHDSVIRSSRNMALAVRP
jgi:hypothetical protein